MPSRLFSFVWEYFTCPTVRFKAEAISILGESQLSVQQREECSIVIGERRHTVWPHLVADWGDFIEARVVSVYIHPKISAEITE